MKKAAYILFKISTILGAILGGIILAGVPFQLMVGFSSHIHEMLVEAYDNGTIVWNDASIQMTGELYATIIQTTLLITGFYAIFVGICCVIGAIIGVRARKQATRGLCIAAIIFGVLSVETLIIAGIFGLISLRKEESLE